jgi:hypothetical protein
MDHKLSCGIVVVRETSDGWLTLLLRIFHHWDFPKGMREIVKWARQVVGG